MYNTWTEIFYLQSLTYKDPKMSTEKINQKDSYLKFSMALFLCLLIRLLPLRAPNVEPIMTGVMPMSKAYGALVGFIFAFLSIICYDLITGTLGVWSILTSLSYGVIGLASALFFQNREATGKNFAIFAVGSTLFFDAVTGLLTGPLFFDQLFSVALIGQIPFTLLHLVSNVAFAIILSPAIYKLLIKKKVTQEILTITNLNHKVI